MKNTQDLTRTEQQIREARERHYDTWGDFPERPNGTGGDRARDVYSYVDNRALSNAANGEETWRDLLEKQMFKAFTFSAPDRLRVELLRAAAIASAWADALKDKEQG